MAAYPLLADKVEELRRSPEGRGAAVRLLRLLERTHLSPGGTWRLPRDFAELTGVPVAERGGDDVVEVIDLCGPDAAEPDVIDGA